jgi:hypothetical protein
MTSRFGWAGRFAATAIVGLTLFTVGCAHRYYDPYNNDYHRWNANERGYYNQWVIEIHGDTHRHYRQLSREDQKRYWEWRHHHEHDRDHDRDRGRDRH